MTSPFAPPPSETPAVLPPNRAGAVPRSSARSLLLWIVLLVMFIALWQFALTPSSARARPEGAPIELMGSLIPLAVYGSMVIALLLIRLQLPASHRTGALREVESLVPPAPPSAAPAAPPAITVELEGRHGPRRAHLRIDDLGLHWRGAAGLVQPAQELHVEWSELQALTPFKTLTRRRGLVITTATHVLQLESADLDADTEARIMAAARARAPSAVPPAGAGVGSVWHTLLVVPLTHLALVFKSDEAIHAHVGTTAGDRATRRLGAVQCRLFGLWSGVLQSVGPLSVGVGAAVMFRSVWSAPVALFGAWLGGLILLSRTRLLFARFSSMSVVR